MRHLWYVYYINAQVIIVHRLSEIVQSWFENTISIVLFACRQDVQLQSNYPYLLKFMIKLGMRHLWYVNFINAQVIIVHRLSEIVQSRSENKISIVLFACRQDVQLHSNYPYLLKFMIKLGMRHLWYVYFINAQVIIVHQLSEIVQSWSENIISIVLSACRQDVQLHSNYPLSSEIYDQTWYEVPLVCIFYKCIGYFMAPTM